MASPGGTVRVFIVDDHEMIRRGFAQLVEVQPALELAGAAATADEALEALQQTTVDVALLDLRLRGTNGIELCREIRVRHPDVRCLMFTAHSDEESTLHAIMAGASGYLLKNTSGEDLVEAIQVVASGGTLLDQETIERILTRRSQSAGPEGLSPQQRRVLDLIGEGLTNRQIGERMGLAEKTVKNYVSAILEKLGVRTRTQAAMRDLKERAEDPGTPEA